MSFARYSVPEIEALWEEENLFSTWLKVELAFCEARFQFGEIPPEVWERIKNNASYGSAGEVKEIEAQTRHDLVAFLRAVEKRLGPDFRYFHEGLTSQDIKDTAFSLLLRDSGKIILKELESLIGILGKQALKFKGLPMVGRTHGIHAEPITFGLKLLRFKKAFERQKENLERSVSLVSVGKFSGPVGTFHGLNPEIARRACQILGLKCLMVSSQIIPRDIYAQFFLSLALISSVVEEAATEIRNLQRTEVGEVFEPFLPGQMGSSAMPHKRNPVLSEQLCGLSRVVRHNCVSVLENVPSWNERDISHSSVERIVSPLSTNLSAYMLKTLSFILENLEVDSERMEENLNFTSGLIFSQNLTLSLVRKGVPREQASRLVQELSFQALKMGSSLRAEAEKNQTISSLLSPGELDQVFDPRFFFENIDRIFALESEEPN
ncbi:MAG: adenylosuccinate lyase [Caldiserica bacterium]|jgi:adenylosuccinate lyase|nr:adenylosuccinate lyase [Caldisericota bacterium]MDH7562754.1 adenylosuccinate lyase [Caldisericota bacterium]